MTTGIENALKMRFGPTWNKTGKGTRPAPMDKLLKRIAKIYDDVGGFKEAKSLRTILWDEVTLIIEEVLSRIPPKDIESAITNLDSNKLRAFAKDIEDDDSERCWYCGTFLKDEDYHRHEEHENFWGAPAYYTAVTGYTCHNCGEQE